MAILTPDTNPNHDTIGHYFKAHGCIYYCDSYDTDIGFWMDPVFGETHDFTGIPPVRTNVSERAIDRTFHTIRNYGCEEKPRYGCQHTLSPEEREFIAEALAPAKKPDPVAPQM